MLNENQIRDKLVVLRDKYYTSMSKIAKDCDISPSYINMILNEKLNFNMSDEVRQKLSDWLESRGF